MFTILTWTKKKNSFLEEFGEKATCIEKGTAQSVRAFTRRTEGFIGKKTVAEKGQFREAQKPNKKITKGPKSGEPTENTKPKNETTRKTN